jgi:protein-L-isoaspartate O-methyltransferase
METSTPPLTRIIEEELIGNRILAYFYYPKYVRTLGLVGSERILEFGSGGGLMSRALVNAIGPDGSLTCVEISGYWIKKAEKRLKKYQVLNFLPGISPGWVFRIILMM